METYRRRKMERRKERKRKEKKMERKGLAISRAGRAFLLLQGLVGAEPTALWKAEMGGHRNPYLPNSISPQRPKPELSS